MWPPVADRSAGAQTAPAPSPDLPVGVMIDNLSHAVAEQLHRVSAFQNLDPILDDLPGDDDLQFGLSAILQDIFWGPGPGSRSVRARAPVPGG